MGSRFYVVAAGATPAAPVRGTEVLVTDDDGHREWVDVGPLLRGRDQAAAATRPSYPPTMSRSEFEALTPRQKMDVATSGKTRLVD